MHRHFFLVPLVLFVAFTASVLAEEDSSALLAEVNGETIHQSDLKFTFLVRGIPQEQQPALKLKLIDELIDQRLIAQYLDEQKATATKDEIELEVARVRQRIEQTGAKPKEVFAAIGIEEDAIRRVVALPLAWGRYAQRVISNQEIREHFVKHQPKYDGTRVHAHQIVLTLPATATETDVTEATNQLVELRKAIVSKKETFADAARRVSQSPSGEKGGDLGTFSYGAEVAREIADIAFSLKKGEVSEPTRTRFGVHLVLVSDVEPGLFSLDDVRREVFNDLSQQRWKRLAAKLRMDAKIALP